MSFKMKILQGKEYDDYQANVSKIEKMSEMETQLAQAQTTLQQMTDATTKLNNENTRLESENQNLTNQVEALKSGSGVSSTKAKKETGKSSGDAMSDAIDRAQSLLKSIDGI